MSMSINITLISRQISLPLDLFLTIGVCDKSVESIHAKIGTYEGITDQRCGQSSHKLNYLQTCVRCVNRKGGQRSQKLIGAESAGVGEFPWIVSFQSNKTKHHFCSGSLLNANWILTAAHCFKGHRKVDTFYMRTGSHEISSGYVERAHKYYLHPKYNLSDPNGPYDLALVFIDKTTRRKRIQPKKKYNSNGICLPEKDIQNDIQEKAYYSGFGRINYKGVRATNLMKSSMTLMPDSECHNHISKYSMACLNSNTSHTCKGDSGSPLVQYVNNKAVLIGIHKGSTKMRGKCGRETSVTTRIRPKRRPKKKSPQMGVRLLRDFKSRLETKSLLKK
ncbi:unnamed protein product [Oppiella nova]|uniref:Peptidase S1 domain-containing protein n=1 Tax=Oppiella nova TaxID=334625 RepID=A0A7R9LHR2_9ACAR|nr:unnamed protein product [Oppiella nova]CAG2163075.1 unnamed protein product [Oppiella nova]